MKNKRLDDFIHKVEEEDREEQQEERDLLELRKEKIGPRDEMIDILFNPQSTEKKWS